ncbi:MAG TPA: zinc-ribbon domain-containing protein [Gallicola sp.]|nr:zinc-ribbon domain-containing protein [Gallicola sp.]
MPKKKWNSQSAKEFIESKGYTVIKNDYDKTKRMHFQDENGYKFSPTIYSFERNGLHIVSKYNPYSIRNIRLWCHLNNKTFKLISTQYKNAHVKLRWQCLKKGCLEIFEENWNNISSGGYNCSYCIGRQVGLSNCLATKNPELAKEWHPTKNGDLTPYDVTCGNQNEVWWKCSKNPKHEWKAVIGSRSLGIGCPYCSGRLPTEDYNLLVCNPELYKEWNHLKNKRKPEQYTPNSGKHVWWKCKECEYEWSASIYARNSLQSGCPNCNLSNGEKKIRQYLDFRGVKYIIQKEFDGLVGLGGGLLSYDFYLPDYNLLIEYQGEQHEKPIDFKGLGKKYAKEQFKIQQEHDKRKREYAQNNNIKLLEIWYWDFDNIEEILSSELKNKLYNLKEEF